MWKPGKVVMLPTKDYKAPIFIGDRDNFLISTKWREETKQWFFRYLFQHLYIVSDEEIKEGDWCFDHFTQTVIQFDGKYNDYIQDYFHKIIATTDLLLISNEFSSAAPIYLPQPPQSFIDKYILEYNKGNVITDVMVEYESIGRMKSGGIETHITELLKINPDNTINIQQIKDSYTREEMELAFNAGRSYGYVECAKGYGVDFPEGTPESSKPQLFDKWIEQKFLKQNI